MTDKKLGIDSRLLSISKNSKGSSASRQRKSIANYQRLRKALGSSSYALSNSNNFIEDTIILDIGGRYSKCGFAAEVSPRRIHQTYLRLGDERVSKPFFGQKFKNGVKLFPSVLSLSKISQSRETWKEISELLINDILFNELEIKPDKRRIIILKDPFWCTSFQNTLAKSCFRHLCPGIQFVNSLHTAIYCTGSTTAIVVDVGYHTTKIQATQNGHIIPETLGWKNIGFYSIMQEFKKLMRDLAKLNFDKFRVDEDQIEKAITRTCFVSPIAKSKQNIYENEDEFKEDNNDDDDDIMSESDSDDEAFYDLNKEKDAKEYPTIANTNSVSYEFNVQKQSAFCKITPMIRKKVCEVLFSKKYNIVHFLLDTIVAAPIDSRTKLINNILLTGGTCALPGFEARFIQEFKYAMHLPKYKKLRPLKHRFRLLNPPFPHNIRMFVGCSIYAEITKRFIDELFITKSDFENVFDGKIFDWTESSIYRNESGETKDSITHLKIIKNPKYRTRVGFPLFNRSNFSSQAKKRSTIGIMSNRSKSPRMGDSGKGTKYGLKLKIKNQKYLSKDDTTPVPEDKDGNKKITFDLPAASPAKYERKTVKFSKAPLLSTKPTEEDNINNNNNNDISNPIDDDDDENITLSNPVDE